MKLSSLLWILAVIGILSLIIRFAGFILVGAIRFWYITIPVILIIVWSNSKKQVKEEKKSKVEDAEFEIIEDENEDK
jgi:4-hydroxybenzoate polyprenyltransferase